MPVSLTANSEADKRVERAHDDLLRLYGTAPGHIRSWVTGRHHSVSTTLDSVRWFAQAVAADENQDVQSWYSDQVEAVSSLQESMSALSATLDTLCSVAREAACGTGPKVSSLIWASFGVLIITANTEHTDTLTFRQVRSGHIPISDLL